MKDTRFKQNNPKESRKFANDKIFLNYSYCKNYMSKLEDDLIEALIKNDVINERLMRDFQIRKRYKHLREVEKLKGKEARTKLADEFNTGEKNIEDIIYSRKRIEA